MKCNPTFSLKSLFAITLFVALVVSAFSLRPKPEITIHIGPQQLQVNQVPLVDNTSLALENSLRDHSQYRELWGINPRLHLRAEADANMNDVLEALDIGKQLGFSDITFSTDKLEFELDSEPASDTE